MNPLAQKLYQGIRIINGNISIMLLCSMVFLASQGCNPSKRASSNGNVTTHYSSGNASTSDKKIREDVVNFAKKQVGTKYKYAGSDPKSGFDCSGFTCYVMTHYDVLLSRTSSAQSGEGKNIPVSKARTGDLVFFGSGGKVSHVALVVSNDSKGLIVVHSTSSKGVIVQNISESSYWKPKILWARDIIGDSK